MTNNTHTPGPLRIYQGRIQPLFHKYGRSVPEKDCNESHAICGEFYGPDAPFNQTLIAAAPDLLEAAKYVVRESAILADFSWIEVCKKAIAKAEGKKR